MSNNTTPEFEFDQGWLLITSPQLSVRLRWKPTARAEELVTTDRWQPCWPDFRILRPRMNLSVYNHYGIELTPAKGTDSRASGKAYAFNRFRDEIPDKFITVTEAFCSHQWPLLEMLARQPFSFDLATSNPVLAYALANNNLFRHTNIEAAGFQAAAYSLRKQRWILDWLGFPGTKAAEKLFRKIPPEEASPYLLRRLKFALLGSRQTVDLLGHQPVINSTILELVTNKHISDSITPRLLDDARQMASHNRLPENHDGDFSLGDKILNAIGMQQEIAPERPLPKFTSIENVEAYYDEVYVEYEAYQERLAAEREERRQAEERARQLAELREQTRRRENARLQRQLRALEDNKQKTSKTFPPPPLPGTASIQPITTDTALRQEGYHQKNCVYSYAWKVRLGNMYIYRVTAPERATLAIFRGSDGCWRRSELKGHCNRKVKRTTVGQVDQWLQEYSISV